MLALIIAFCVEAFFEELVGEDSSLGEAVHAHPNFNVYPTLVVDEIT